MNRTDNNYKGSFGVSESLDIWDIQIKKLKKRNDLLADADEIPERGNSQGKTKSSPNNQSQE